MLLNEHHILVCISFDWSSGMLIHIRWSHSRLCVKPAHRLCSPQGRCVSSGRTQHVLLLLSAGHVHSAFISIHAPLWLQSKLVFKNMLTLGPLNVRWSVRAESALWIRMLKKRRPCKSLIEYTAEYFSAYFVALIEEFHAHARSLPSR